MMSSLESSSTSTNIHHNPASSPILLESTNNNKNLKLVNKINNNKRISTNNNTNINSNGQSSYHHHNNTNEIVSIYATSKVPAGSNHNPQKSVTKIEEISNSKNTNHHFHKLSNASDKQRKIISSLFPTINHLKGVPSTHNYH